MQIIEADSDEVREKILSWPNKALFTTFTTHLGNSDDPECYLLAPELHLEKLFDDASSLGFSSIEGRAVELERSILNLLDDDIRKNPRIRRIYRVLVSNLEINIFTSNYPPLWQEVDAINLVTVNSERADPSFKYVSADISLRARQFATANGAHEALLVGNDNVVLEGAWSNFFWIRRDGAICTPATRIYPGIVRKLVIDTTDVIESECKLPDLLKDCRSAFITQSTSFLKEVRRINSVELEPISDLLLQLSSSIRSKFLSSYL